MVTPTRTTARDSNGNMIIPEHNMVSSEREKKVTIERAYEYARREIIPPLIDLLDKYEEEYLLYAHAHDDTDTDSWVISSDLFFNNDETLLIPKSISSIVTKFCATELWTNPDYIVVHNGNGHGNGHDDVDVDDDVDDNDEADDNDKDATASTSNDCDQIKQEKKVRIRNNNNNNNNNNIKGTTTEVYLGGHQKLVSSTNKTKKTKKSKSKKKSPDKCLLRHKFSNGFYHYRVCKLPRRHQKEIAKRLLFWNTACSSSRAQDNDNNPLPLLSSSSAFLEGFTRSAVLKKYYYN